MLGDWITADTREEFRVLIGAEFLLGALTLSAYGGRARVTALSIRFLYAVRNLGREIQSALPDHEELPKLLHPWPEPQLRNHDLLQWSLILLTLIHFVIVGRLIALTGGVTTSPVAQFALTMIVLGISVVRRTYTRLLFSLLGILLFVAVLYEFMGSPNPREPSSLDGQVVIAIGLNLIVAYFFAPQIKNLKGEVQTIEPEGIASSEAFGGPTIVNEPPKPDEGPPNMG